MPEVKVCLLPSSVALEVGTARVPAPLALALPSLPLESPHGASMLGLYALTPSVTRVGCPGRTWPQGEAGRGGHPGPRAPRPAAGHPQRGPGGTSPSLPWSCAHMTALPGLPFPPSFPTHSHTSFRVSLNAVLRAACSPLLSPSGPAGASGRQTRAHQLSSHLLTAQLCVCPSAHEGRECEDVRSHVGSRAARHMLWVECRVSACLLTGVCKLHEGKERECAVCSAWGIAGSVACVPCLRVRGTHRRPSTQSTARVSCSQTERLHCTFEPPAENSRLSSQKADACGLGSVRANTAAGPGQACARSLLRLPPGSLLGLWWEMEGSAPNFLRQPVILRDTCSHLKRGFWGEVVPKAGGRYQCSRNGHYGWKAGPRTGHSAVSGTRTSSLLERGHLSPQRAGHVSRLVGLLPPPTQNPDWLTPHLGSCTLPSCWYSSHCHVPLTPPPPNRMEKSSSFLLDPPSLPNRPA